MPRPRHTHAGLAAFVAAALAVLGGCGYTVGRSFETPVETVAVPTFTNETYRRGLEQQLTEAVHREIQDRTPFRLVRDNALADTRLTGTIIKAEKYNLTQTPFGDPRQLDFQLMVSVTWEDLRTGQVLGQTQIPIAPGSMSLVSQEVISPEAGQSRATTERKAVDNMARQVVDLMETPW